MKRIFIGLFFSIATFSFIFCGSISGNVKYNGKKKKPRPVKMDADPVCGTSHSKPVFKQSLMIDENNNIENTIVYIKNINYEGDVPKEPAILDQKGCIYVPHVLGVMKGQDVLIKNSDATLHNIHGLPEENSEFNFAMPKVVKEKTITLAKSETAFKVKCDVHPWMNAYVQVFDHPYFSVTSKDGSYKIENVPPGTYEIIAWQETFAAGSKFVKKFGKLILSEKVIVEKDKNTVQNFTFDITSHTSK